MKNSITPFYHPTEKLLSKSKDCFQYDSEGREYIDFESGVWCVNIGHSNPRITKRIISQIKKSVHQGYKFRNQCAEDLSQKLQDLIGFKNGSSVFLSSGSEAINLSISIAQHITGKEKILKIDSTYLSAYGYGQIKPDNEYVVSVQINCPDSLLNIDFDKISAIIIELGGASIKPVNIPDYQFIKQLSDLAIENECLLIVDEVTTGFGRLGKWFGFQDYILEPNIVVTGKALGNGYPISAVTLSQITTKQFYNNSFGYAQSHQNDPLGCAIGLEVISVIEEYDLIFKCQKIGQYFMQQLNEIQELHQDKIKEVRGRGLMLAVEFSEDTDGEKINNELFNKGFLIGFKNNTLRFLPPLTIKASDIDKMIEALNKILS